MPLNWLLAALPLCVVLICMLGLHWSAARAGAAGWLAALLIAAWHFGADWILLAWAQGKALLFAFHVLYVIWMALVFYQILKQAGVFTAISAHLPNLVTDRSMQTLLLAWAFGAFLEGPTGFGIPAAIVAPLLVEIGYAPVAAVVMASLGQAWAVTFGGLGNSLFVLATATQRQANDLAPYVGVLLSAACLVCGLVVLWVSGGLKAVRRNLGIYVVMGTGMVGVFYAITLTPMFPLAAMGAGLTGMGLVLLWSRLTRRKIQSEQPPAASKDAPSQTPLWLALMPYVFLIVIVVATQWIGPLNQFLNQVVIAFQFPEMHTALGHVTPAGPGRPINVFGHVGTLIAYTALASFMLLLWKKQYPDHLAQTAQKIWAGVLPSALPVTLGTLTMVAMAVTMEHAGMTLELARGISQAAGTAYPAAAPFIGALGAFMTGSNANSNVLFSTLQRDVAQLLALNPAWILAAQTAGGSIGGAFSPAKILLGCSTVGLIGQERKALKPALIYGVMILAVLSLVVLGLTTG